MKITQETAADRILSGGETPPPEITENSKARTTYITQYKNCLARHKILFDELEDLNQNMTGSRRKREGIDATMQTLNNEKQIVTSRMISLGEELELIEKHIQEQKSKSDLLEHTSVERQAQKLLVQRAVASLEAEIEKTWLLADGLGATVADLSMPL